MRSLTLLRIACSLCLASCLPAPEDGESSTSTTPSVLVAKVSGTCAASSFSVDVRALAGVITLTSPDPSELPMRGLVSPTGQPLRQGGWVLSGSSCTPGVTCPHRVCTALRESWYLKLSCVDDAGAPICSATLSE